MTKFPVLFLGHSWDSYQEFHPQFIFVFFNSCRRYSPH